MALAATGPRALLLCDPPPPPLVKALLITSAVGLAFLSWFLVEQPLRRPGSRRKAFAISAAVMVLLLSLGLALWLSRGFPQRLSPDVVKLQHNADRKPHFCFGCGTGNIVLWGDSQAASLAPAMSAVAFTKAGCPPLLGAAPTPACARFEQRAFDAIRKLPKVETIVLAGRWALATETVRLGDEPGGRYYLEDARSGPNSIGDSRRAFAAALPRTVQALEQAHPTARIVLIGQVPEPGFDVSQCAIRARMFGRSLEPCEFASRASLARLEFSNGAIRAIAARDPNVTAIFMDRLMCADGRCRTTVGPAPLYRDFDHLTPDAARAILSEPLRASLARRSAP